jgi:hypothetical protein
MDGYLTDNGDLVELEVPYTYARFLAIIELSELHALATKTK